MPEALLQPLQPPTLPFNEFLAALFEALKREKVRCCVLRNYEKFPAKNIGGDVDFLLSPPDLPRAMRALRSIQGIRITCYSRRSWVAHAFVEGVSAADGMRSLQVDFLWCLNWKGQPYLHTDAILRAAILRPAGNLHFLVPSPVHEAIVSLFSSLLVGGWLKEKYFPKAQKIFAGDRLGVIAALRTQFGLKVSTRLVDSVIGGDRKQILGCISSLRRALFLHNFLRRPLRAVSTAFRYYAAEVILRYSPATLENVCLLSLDGGGSAAIVEKLLPMLKSAVKFIERQPCGNTPLLEGTSGGAAARADSAQESSRGVLVSMAALVLWLAKEWRSKFQEKKNITLRICERSCYDLLIHPGRYGYGGPIWFARLAAKLFPSPELMILLAPAAKEARPGNRVVPQEETNRQLEACRPFLRGRRRYVILDAGKPAASLAEEAYTAIIDALVQRSSRQLGDRL